MRSVLPFFLILFLLSCTEEENFITDKIYREIVNQDFQVKKNALKDSPKNLFAIFDKELTLKEKGALEFLYAYSPLIDISTFDGEYFLNNIRLAFQAMEEMPWGERIPEDIFRNFVLPVRGGKENLDNAREVFYKELKERVINSDNMEQAALEVNHWCHEKVIYKPTNARTFSPLATVKNAYGRCGEESIFTLAALRSVGIPARQIYTPRWAHCDDNHAWIEVWVDGEWKYLGACEPEPKLNIAWFTAPVQHAMYVVSEVFGVYNGNEEIALSNSNGSLVNVTSNYTKTKKPIIQIKDENNNPVKDANVQYKIFNYGEYYPVATLKTDANGEVSLTLGMGDIVIYAEKDNKFNFAQMNVAETDRLEIILNKRPHDEFAYEFSLVPPKQEIIPPLSSGEERAENDRRLMYEDSIRFAYEATFMTGEQAQKIAQETGVNSTQFAKFIHSSRGNHAEIVKFIVNTPRENRGIAMELLEVVPEKDLQDTGAEVFLSHVQEAQQFKKNPDFKDYILNPRVKNELLTSYRKPIMSYLENKKVSDITSLIQEVKKIKLLDDMYPHKVAIPPIGLINSGAADIHSRDIFFVSASRTMGIPARLNPVTGKPEYKNNAEWITVNFEVESTPTQGLLMVDYSQKTVNDPNYFLNFTIAKWENGTYKTIDLGSNASVDMGAGASYSKIFAKPIFLDEGEYILCTGNRRSDGAVMATLSSFRVYHDEITRVEMKVLPTNDKLEILGEINPKISFISEKGTHQIIDYPDNGYTALAILETNKEPTNHYLRDLGTLKEDLEKLNVQMNILFRNKEDFDKFNKKEFRPFPQNIIWGYDINDGQLLNQISQQLKLQNQNNLPLVLVLNKKGEVIFISQGYRVGLGTQMLKMMNM